MLYLLISYYCKQGDSMKTIWCFGDSWTWGSELWDNSICDEKDAKAKYGFDYSYKHIPNHSYVEKNRWSNILNSYGEFSINNYGIPGSTNEIIVDTIIDTVLYNTLPDVVIIAWTTQTRKSVKLDNWQDGCSIKDRFKIIDSPKSRDENFQLDFYKEVVIANSVLKKSKVINVNAFHKNIPYLQFDTDIYFATDTLLSVATNGAYKEITEYTENIHWFFYKSIANTHENLKKIGHPNETGHALIAKYIATEMTLL